VRHFLADAGKAVVQREPQSRDFLIETALVTVG
jgi:hypothetical protein